MIKDSSMSDFKEFQGKTLDAAIAEACAYYDAPREKLEIDIVEDAKTGIFGLVGARKARIRARRAQLPELTGRGNKQTRQPDAPDEAPAKSRQNRGAKPEKGDRQPRGRKPAPEDENPQTREASAPLPKEASDALPAEAPEQVPAAGPQAAGQPQTQVREPMPEQAGMESAESPDAPKAAGQDSRRNRPPRAPRTSRPDNGPAHPGPAKGSAAEDTHEGDMPELALPRVALADLDQDKLRAVTAEMVQGLVFPIVGEVPLEVSLADDRVQVRVDCEDTGLLIGREGQNLAAVQYLAARMVTRAMGAQVRVQVDAGDYRSRQDSHLQELAFSLAEKVRATGKSQSTRPLSAYQRRVIHLTLQEDPDVQTRSSGEGALKRVVVQRRKEQN